MASRIPTSAGSAGDTDKSGSSGRAGKVGRSKTDSKADSKQRKLEIGKSVSFRDEVEMKRDLGILRDEMKEMREQISKEVGKFEEIKESFAQYVEEIKGKERKNEERIKGIENKLFELENRLERCEKGETDIGSESESQSQRSVSESRFSRRSRGGSSYARSLVSEGGLSDIEVGKLKRWMKDKEKEDRRNNVVIRGINLEQERDWKEWAQNFLRDKLGVRCKVINVRKSGTVTVVKLEEEDKKEVMRNKYKLKGGNIFIENDLTWEERKVQEEIYRWVKVQKSNGVDVKAGYARVRINGVWKSWEEVSRNLEDRDGSGGSLAAGRDEGRAKENLAK
ncbi:uncharacterized protein LOC112465472 [Temnothorax curvispinosus]|uniref:Uncharacterized protein LOC112465472 n=1 Tax=Temnothorax curvispinosus TaxID=300111 RepID=A0A6J1R3U4_9HYME|nr:uncharacterized protein LOC112465472 [Temnothorax curvispinosus]